MKLDRILVTTDFSPGDREIIQKAMALAAQLGVGEITLFHAHAEPILTDFGVSEPLGRPNDLRDEVLARLTKWSEELSTPTLRINPLTRAGRPAHAIVDVSEDFDLIVMGSHGGGAAKHFLLGSTTDRVVRGAHCDVWVVRVPQQG